MLADPFIAPKLSSGTSWANFTLLPSVGNSIVRENLVATAGNPRDLTISHQLVGKKGGNKRNRRAMRLSLNSLVDGIEDTSKVASFTLVADVPETGITDAQIAQLRIQFVGILLGSSGDVADNGDETVFFDRFLAGEG